MAETGMTLDDLDAVSRDRIMQEAKKRVLADMKDTLLANAKKEVMEEAVRKGIAEDLDRRMKRTMAFLTALVPLLDRYSVFASKELADQNPLDTFASKWPGTCMNKRNRITVAGLIASIGYQMTCRADGMGGWRLAGSIDPASHRIVGFEFVGQSETVLNPNPNAR